jgi:hypothetical protein
MATATPNPPDELERLARELARAHRESDESITGIYFARDHAGREIRLVEVSSEVDTTNEVLPVRFGARPDLRMPRPSVIVLLSAEEWDALQQGALSLPTGWTPTHELVRLV